MFIACLYTISCARVACFQHTHSVLTTCLSRPKVQSNFYCCLPSASRLHIVWCDATLSFALLNALAVLERLPVELRLASWAWVKRRVLWELVRVITDSVLSSDLVSVHVLGRQPASSVEELSVADVTRLFGLLFLRDLSPGFLREVRHAKAAGHCLSRDRLVVVNRVFSVAHAMNRGPLRVHLDARRWNRLATVLVGHRLNRVPLILHAWLVPKESLFKITPTS